MKVGVYMQSELAELNNLRNEIISDQQHKRNVWLHMYILFVSLFVIGLEASHYTFLLTFVILIPYQEVINNMDWNVSRISAYIRIFYEKKDPNLNWETMNTKYIPYKSYLDKRTKGVSGFIRNAGSIHLGFMATAFFIGQHLSENYTANGGTISLNITDALLLILSVVLLFVIILINHDGKKDYKLEIEPIIEGYKREVMSRNVVDVMSEK